MSSGSSCQKSDKDQPPCPKGLFVKNQTLKVRPWNSKQRIWSVNKGTFFWNLHNKVFIWSQNTSQPASLLKFRKEGMQSFTTLPLKWTEVQGVNTWWPPSSQQQGSWPWPRLSVLQFVIQLKEQIKSNNFRYSKDRMRMHYKVFCLCQGYLFDPWNTCDRGELNLAHNAIFWYIQNMLQCYTDTYNTCYELYKYIQNMLQAT